MIMMRTREETLNLILASALSHNVFVVSEYINQRTKLVAICGCGNVCNSRPDSILVGTGWCTSCGGNSAKDAALKFQQLARELKFEILGKYINNMTPVALRCSKGHQTTTTYTYVAKYRRPCSVCSGYYSDRTKNEFYRQADFDNIIVIGSYLGYDDKIEIRCQYGHINMVRPDHGREGKWCGECTKKWDRIYIVVNKIQEFAKFGVASGPMRTTVHRRNGWTLYGVWGGLSHAEAIRYEADLKNMKHRNGWPSYEGFMPQAGNTETFPLIHIDQMTKYIRHLVDPV